VQINMIISNLNEVPKAVVSCFVDIDHIDEEPLTIDPRGMQITAEAKPPKPQAAEFYRTTCFKLNF